MTVLTPEQALELPHAMAEATKYPEWENLIDRLIMAGFRKLHPEGADALLHEVARMTVVSASKADVVRIDPKVTQKLWGQGDGITLPTDDETFSSHAVFVFDEAIPEFRYENGGTQRCVGAMVSGVRSQVGGEDFSGWLIQLIVSRNDAAVILPESDRYHDAALIYEIPLKYFVMNFKVVKDGQVIPMDGHDEWSTWLKNVYELVATLMWWTNDKLVSGAQRLPRPQRRNVERKYGVKVGDIRYVALRRTLGATKRAEASGVAIDWSHRWHVRGHKRHLADGRVINVRPYVKGPDDKPIIVKQRLYEAKR